MSDNIINKTISKDYKYGFETNIEQDTFEPGINKDVIHKLSKIKNEPSWLLKWRLKAFNHWQKMTEPSWANIKYSPESIVISSKLMQLEEPLIPRYHPCRLTPSSPLLYNSINS